jgi:acyl dehydratase
MMDKLAAKKNDAVPPVGTTICFSFSVTEEDMRAFAQISGDHSPVHTDVLFARRNGFNGVVVYGGLLVAKVSRLIGMELPAGWWMSTRYQINFRGPLYVGQAALFHAEIVGFSEAVRLLQLRFRITVGDRTIATGSAEAVLLEDGRTASESITDNSRPSRAVLDCQAGRAERRDNAESTSLRALE